MPSLRELFLAIPKHQVHKESRALLEGLVETVTLLVVAVSTLDPEPTEIEVVAARIDTRRQLAEAKAEIEGLRKQRDEWPEKAIAQANTGTLFVVPNQEFEADADLGKKVRGMRLGSTLRHTTDCADRPDWVAHWSGGGGCIIINSGSDDPAEALRAIQEVRDAEA